LYNYKELRAAMPSEAWHTSSDTEVLLRQYLAHGTKAMRNFEGMWAFAIYDRQQHRLVLSRDRFGEKPLYLWERPEGLYFASEIKFLFTLANARAPINYRHLRR